MTIDCRACELRVSSCMACCSPGTSSARGERLDGGAVDDELAHRVHQRVEPLGVDAHGARRAALRRRACAAPAARPGGCQRRGGAGGASGVRRGGAGLRRGGRRSVRRRARPASAISTSATSEIAGERWPRRPSSSCSRERATPRSAARRSSSTSSSARHAADQLAVLGQRGEHHVRAHGRHRAPSSESVTMTCSTRSPAAGRRPRSGTGSAPPTLARSCSGVRARTRLVQPLDQRRRVERLLARRPRSTSTAPESASRQASTRVDGLAGQAAAALAQQLEDVLHLVGELGDARRSPSSRSCP